MLLLIEGVYHLAGFLRPQDYISHLVEFAGQVESEAIAAMREDVSFGDIPEEFKGYYII